MGGEDRNGQRADVGGGGDDPQRRSQRGIVARREQRRHQHEIGHAIADRLERVLGGVGQDQLGADALAHHGRQRVALAPIRFDGKNDGHPTLTFAA